MTSYVRAIAGVLGVGIVLAALVGGVATVAGMAARDGARVGLLVAAVALGMFGPTSTVHDIVIDGVMGQEQRRPGGRAGDRDLDGIELGWLGVLLFGSVPLAIAALLV